MQNIVSDSSKFTQVSLAEDKNLNFIVNVEKHLTDLFKDLKNSLKPLFLKPFIKGWNWETVNVKFFMVF